MYTRWIFYTLHSVGLTVKPVPVYTVSGTLLVPVAWETDHIQQVSLGEDLCGHSYETTYIVQTCRPGWTVCHSQ